MGKKLLRRPGWMGGKQAEPVPAAELPPAIMAQQTGEEPLAEVGEAMMSGFARTYDGPGTWRMVHLTLPDGSAVVGPMLCQDADSNGLLVLPATAAAMIRAAGRVKRG